ncbi:hypothetical protein [Desulfovibrio cuneatus]|uniref:hypothetical protein n=1 Tax=Desulfovibrio cuneatus TaxID=159728 RepID=UPI0004099AFF|nr:hypothetical protein [Desulfovibrio cuneatus]
MTTYETLSFRNMKFAYIEGNKIVHGQEPVATKVKATMDSDPGVKGQAPQPNALKNIMKSLHRNFNGDNFIKGHLFNEHLGGQGNYQNLFPITAKANTSHEEKVEGCLKDWWSKLPPMEESDLTYQPGRPQTDQDRQSAGGKRSRKDSTFTIPPKFKKVIYEIEIKDLKPQLTTENPECSINYKISSGDSTQEELLNVGKFDSVPKRPSIFNKLLAHANPTLQFEHVEQSADVPEASSGGASARSSRRSASQHSGSKHEDRKSALSARPSQAPAPQGDTLIPYDESAEKSNLEKKKVKNKLIFLLKALVDFQQLYLVPRTDPSSLPYHICLSEFQSTINMILTISKEIPIKIDDDISIDATEPTLKRNATL